MITLDAVTKTFADRTAVDGLTVNVRPGRVTGFLGPNGAGKSTTMRIIVGLDHPDRGEALISGRRYAELHSPLRHVGAHLDSGAAHPGRRARSHLLGLARHNGIARQRVDEVIDQVGIGSVANQRVGAFSLGMRQRLGIAAALLGDPAVLLFDEPANGLDTDGIRWIRELLRRMASEGRTVLVSSHLLAEMHQTADHVIVIGRGRLLADMPTSELVGRSTDHVEVLSPDGGALRRLTRVLGDRGIVAHLDQPGRLTATTVDCALVGDIAFAEQVPIHRLTAVKGTLEDGYLRLVGDHAEFTAGIPEAPR